MCGNAPSNIVVRIGRNASEIKDCKEKRHQAAVRVSIVYNTIRSASNCAKSALTTENRQFLRRLVFCFNIGIAIQVLLFEQWIHTCWRCSSLLLHFYKYLYTTYDPHMYVCLLIIKHLVRNSVVRKKRKRKKKLNNLIGHWKNANFDGINADPATLFCLLISYVRA